MRFSFLIPLIFFGFSVFSQPVPYGCQHWRTLNGKGLPAHAERSMNQSILRSDTFDILHYDISIDITNYAGQSIQAATEITFSPKMAGQDHIRFDLMLLTVDSVKNADGAMVFSYENDILRINFSEIPDLSDTLSLTVYYHGNPYRDPTWGGFYFDSGYIYNLGIGLTSIPPNFGKVWYPCFDSFVERATYSYHVKSAGTFRAHCQGEFTGETALGGDTVIRNFEFNIPNPTHLSAIAAADFRDLDFIHPGNYGPVPVRLTAKPADTAAMRARFSSLGYAIDACEHWYGPTGYNRIGYVAATTGALEIPENIAYPQFMFGQTNDVNRNLFSHELGHLWWGDWIAPYIHNDMWLKEGPAEYSAHLVAGWEEGNDAFVKIVKDNQYFILNQAHINDDGFFALSPMPDSVIYGDHTYYKGASVMHNLRGYMGDSLFRVGMSGMQANNAFETITPDQFRDALEDETGLDLSDFFNDQVYLPGYSTFVVDSFPSTGNGNSWNVNLHIRQLLRECPAYYSNVPLDVTFLNQNGQREEHRIVADGELTEVLIGSTFNPSMVILNGYNRLNGARMDFELDIIEGQNLVSLLPNTDFRIFKDSVPDTTFMRVEHIWAGPEASLTAAGVFDISATHYWIVDGLWPAGAAFHAQVNIKAIQERDFDFDLFGNTEANGVIVYRENAAHPWKVYSDQTLNLGSLTNGVGTIKIDNLRRGHYAFANGDLATGIKENELNKSHFTLYPNPADKTITVSGNETGTDNLSVSITSIDGKLMLSKSFKCKDDFSFQLDVSDLTSGNYLLKVMGKDGVKGIEKIMIVH